MIRPQGERPPDLGLVARAVVNAGHPCLVPATVVDYGLNDVRLDAKFGHAGCNGPANVMNAPCRDRATLLLYNASTKDQRRIAPSTERPLTASENQCPPFFAGC